MGFAHPPKISPFSRRRTDGGSRSYASRSNIDVISVSQEDSVSNREKCSPMYCRKLAGKSFSGLAIALTSKSAFVLRLTILLKSIPFHCRLQHPLLEPEFYHVACRWVIFGGHCPLVTFGPWARFIVDRRAYLSNAVAVAAVVVHNRD